MNSNIRATYLAYIYIVKIAVAGTDASPPPVFDWRSCCSSCPHPPPFQIDLTLQRKDPSEFIAEEAEMARFRRLGCAWGTNTLRV